MLFFAKAHNHSPWSGEWAPLKVWGFSLALGVLIAVQESFQPASLGELSALPALLNRVIPISLSAGLFVPSAFWITQRLPLFPRVRRRALAIHLAAAFALPGLFLLAAATLRALLLVGASNIRLSPSAAIRDYAPYYSVLLFCYCTIVGAISVRGFQRQTDQRERELKESKTIASQARLESLRRELYPHLLFNLLNSISCLVLEGDRRRAVRALSDVSQLLRVFLAREQTFVELRRELEFVEMFVDLHRIRLGDRVRLEKRVDPAALELQIPTFLLQPLVENAIEHGVILLEDGGTVTVEATVDSEYLELCVTNPAPIERSGKNSQAGIGLENTRERVAQAYGGRGSFTFSVTEESAVARVTIPLRAPPEVSGEARSRRRVNSVFGEGYLGRYALP